jgi:O-glycosyl hydrolase
MKNITIDTKKMSPTNDGVFEGWGTSLCWWANRVGFSEKLTRDSAKLFFSKEDGLGLNIMRYNIGGGDDPTHNHIRRTDSEMPGWWKYDEDKKEFVFNADTDKNQLAVLRVAYEASGDDAFVEAFSNSPPYYMTVSGCSSGGKNSLSNNLKKSQIIPFANYLAEVCEYIQNNHKVKIKSLAAMNEPFTNYWRYFSEKQEGCHVSPGKMQSSVLVAAANALKERGLDDIIVTATDETNTKRQLKALRRLSDEALSVVGRVSTHTYEKATPKVGDLARKLGKNIWMSETDWSSISGENAGEMGPALWLSEKIIEDMNTIKPSAWVIWQIVAAYISRVPDEKGRLDMPGMPDLTNGFWGTAFADIDKEEIYLTQKYYAFGQFSKFIRPGMTIVHTDKKSLAAYDKATGRLVLVCVNTKAQGEDINAFFHTFGEEMRKITPIRTSGDIKDGEHWAEIESFNAQTEFSYTLKGNSVTTFIIDKI